MHGFIIYIIVSVFTPGPNNIFASISSARVGIMKSMRFMLGILVGTFIVFSITAIFNVYLYNNIRIITQIIGILGGLFIIYLAVKMYFTRNEEKLLIKNDRLFIMAVLLNFINAKTIIFGLTAATYYLELGFPAEKIYIFVIIMAVLCFIAVLLWGFFGKLFRKLLNKYRVIYNIVMSALLAYSGILIIIESLT